MGGDLKGKVFESSKRFLRKVMLEQGEGREYYVSEATYSEVVSVIDFEEDKVVSVWVRDGVVKEYELSHDVVELVGRRGRKVNRREAVSYIRAWIKRHEESAEVLRNVLKLL